MGTLTIRQSVVSQSTTTVNADGPGD